MLVTGVQTCALPIFSVDNLSLQTHFSVSQLTDLLFDLEDLNLVKLLPGNRYRLAKR